MERNLSRYELAEIKRAHDEQGYKSVNKEYLSEQLKRLGLPQNASRFQVAEKIRELEKKIV